jgi:chlorobactene glucosyltransferase
MTSSRSWFLRVPAASLQAAVLGTLTWFAIRQNLRVRRFCVEAVPPVDVDLPADAPFVTIVLPVRDEEHNIDDVLDTVLGQDYPDFDVVVVDDGSTDATPVRLKALADGHPRLRVLRVDELPEGWAGKAHALHVGVQHATSPWLLFTDADTRHRPDSLRKMMVRALSQGDDLLSLYTDMGLSGVGANLLNPVGFLVLNEHGLPSEIRDPTHPGAFAIGQYLLVRRAAYELTGGLANLFLRESFAEDLHLAQLFKRRGLRTDIVGGRGLVENRQWTDWRTAWRGWRKSFYSETARVPRSGVELSLSVTTFGLLPTVAAVASAVALHRGHTRPATRIGAAATVALALQIDSFRRMGRFYGAPWWWAPAAPAAWTSFGLLCADAVRLSITRRGAGWKNRPVPRHGTTIPINDRQHPAEATSSG